MWCDRNGFQKLEKVKDSNRQSRQLEELTEKMRECKRYLSMDPIVISRLLYMMFISSIWNLYYESMMQFVKSSAVFCVLWI